MSVKQRFLEELGFTEDPFAHTNADEEIDRLPQYFISPPYFNDVLGDPDYPESFLVFAPRGGGKTAQRIMIEKSCLERDILPLTYDRFEFTNANSAKEVKIHDHINKIIQFALMGMLATLDSDKSRMKGLSKTDQKTFYRLIMVHLGDLSEPELNNTLNSLKSFREKFNEFWNTWVGIGIRAILKRNDLDFNDAPKPTHTGFLKSRSPKYELQVIVDLAKKIGFRSIYILIDRVDESNLTGNNKIASFELIEPLVKDLDLLEFHGIGFKFFLWDELEPLYKKVARPDRINHRTLVWTDEMLQELWRKRLRAFSDTRIWSLNQISESLSPYSLDELTLIFASKSPRDMIRIGSRVVSEQIEYNSDLSTLTQRAIYKGIKIFSKERADELFNEKTLKEFKTIGTQSRQVDFTIPYIASYIFKEQQGTTRNRIKRWRDEGVIVEVSKVSVNYPKSSQNRPVKLFAVKDVRLAQTMLTAIDLEEFLREKVKSCPNCSSIVIRDWDEMDTASICHECQWDWETGQVDESVITNQDHNPDQMELPFPDWQQDDSTDEL